MLVAWSQYICLNKQGMEDAILVVAILLPFCHLLSSPSFLSGSGGGGGTREDTNLGHLNFLLKKLVIPTGSASLITMRVFSFISINNKSILANTQTFENIPRKSKLNLRW